MREILHQYRVANNGRQRWYCYKNCLECAKRPRGCFVCRQPAQLADDPVLSEELPFGESRKLAFMEHMDSLIALVVRWAVKNAPHPNPGLMQHLTNR
jgi:hypothetical protein